jgi:pyruvate dehydrogenase E2 component (dihydrolipoamide acetyltransferase)
VATEVKLPEVGEGIDSGTVVGILVSVGDSVEVDQPLLELETDKAVVEVPSSAAGTVQEIHVNENEEAKIGQVIVILEEAGKAAEAKPEKEAEPEQEAKQAEAEPEKEIASKQEAEPKKETSASQSTSQDTARKSDRPDTSEGDGSTIPAAPSVRRLARELGVTLADVAGSGVLGRISAADVKQYADTGSARPQAPADQAAAPAAAPNAGVSIPALPDFGKFGEIEREPMSGIRKATVKQMSLAWSTVPMVTNFDKAELTRLEKLRKKYQPYAEAEDAKITPTAMLLKVVAAALKRFPKFNASLDVHNNEVVFKHYINIGVAVDTPKGLLVPVIRNVDSKGIVQLSVELGEFAQKARDRKLAPDDMQGGNFSISNLGGIGGTNFTPIVNAPEVAILGVARGGIEPVWNKETETFEAKMMLPLSLTYDHRLIDGADAARFLRFICETVEDPFLMSVFG